MTPREQGTEHRHRSTAMPRHTDGLWCALATAVRDADEDAAVSRRRLAALRLRRTFATISDYSSRRVG
jgi:hypothetical protein